MPIFRGNQFVSSASDFKDSVRACSTVDVNLATSVGTVDGVSLVTDDRVLLTNQNLGRENGIYRKNSSGLLVRARDADSAFEVTSGITVYVEEGTVHGSSSWILTTHAPITVGTTALAFSKVLQIDTGLDGTYGAATKTLAITISEAGAISSVTEHTLNTDNVTEGSTNQYFTQTRARAAISASTGITIAAGAISVDTNTVATLSDTQTLDNKTIDGGSF